MTHVRSCKGCNKSGFCDFQMNGTTEDCPCYDCIVKSTCWWDNICEDMNNFHRKIFGFDHGEFKKCQTSD